MTYSQTKVSASVQNTLTSVLPWSQKLEHTIPVARSPYLKPSFFRVYYKKFLIFCSAVVQRVARRELYSLDDKATLYQLSPEARALLSWLTQQQLLESWNFGRSVPDMPELCVLYLRPKPVTTPLGGYYPVSGANGIGAGTTMREAELSALGEFIERNASGAYWVENPELFAAPYSSSNTKMIDPALFQMCTDDQLTALVSYINRYQSGQTLHWVPAAHFATGKKVFVPAVLVYMFFKNDFQSEPFLQETSSNGCATYTSYKEASNRALLECVERHVFVKMWYQKRVPKTITLQSLSEVFPDVKKLLRIVSDEYKLYVLDITDEFNIPTTVAFTTDTRAGHVPLHITAASDPDPHLALQKTLKEIIRFSMNNYGVADIKERSEEFYNDYHALQAEATSLVRRAELWSDPHMLQHIDWLTRGSSCTYAEVISKYHTVSLAAGQTEHSRHSYLQSFVKKHDLRVYAVNITNSVARYSGLEVVRVLSPDLIPISFNEAALAQNSRSLTHDKEGRRIPLNPIPHPFL